MGKKTLGMQTRRKPIVNIFEKEHTVTTLHMVDNGSKDNKILK